MALFELQGPDGKMYEIEAPDVQSAANAFQQMSSTPPTKPELTVGEKAADVAKSAGIGVAQGVLNIPALPGNLEYLARAGVDKGATFLGYEDPKLSDNTLLPTFSDIKKRVEGYTGEFYKPKTTAGEYARTIGEFAPLAALPGGLAARATNVLAPAVTSETAGQLTKGTSYEPYARAAGALAGGVLPSAAMRTVSPMPMASERAAHVARLEREGVKDLTAGQKTGSQRLRTLESVALDTPFSGGSGSARAVRQAEQFTAAALKRAGVTANRADTDTMNAAFVNIGKRFDDLAAQNGIRVDRRLFGDVKKAVSDYDALVPPSQRAPIIDGLLNDIRNLAAPGQGIAGDTYQALRSRIEKLSRGSSDPQLSSTLRNIRGALDDAMERSMKPADRGSWRQTREQYRNLLAIEKAVAGAGENTAAGLISPSQLRNAVRSMGQRRYVRGQDDLGNLARSGEAIMKPLPNSGTAPRMVASGLLGYGGYGALSGDYLAAALTVGGPAIAARALMSRPVQNYFSNRVMGDAITAYEGQRLNAFSRLPQAANYFEASRGISGGMGPQYDESGNPLPGSRAEEELMRRQGLY